jgi:hypothetical protein
MVGGSDCHLLGVTDKILTHAEIKHYTNIGIHNDYYTLAITVIGTIRFYRMVFIENSKLYHLIHFFFVKKHFC